jgi:hypothetical protein
MIHLYSVSLILCHPGARGTLGCAKAFRSFVSAKVQPAA